MAHGNASPGKQTPAALQRFRPLRRLAYWGGRLCQVIGLLLLWCVLLIFPTAEDIRALLYGRGGGGRGGVLCGLAGRPGGP